MSWLLVGVGLLIVLLAIGILAGAAPEGAAPSEEFRLKVHLPEELRGARVLRERQVQSITGRKVTGRMDELWTLEDGTRIPADIKTRRAMRVYASDVMQLSVYAYAMRNDGTVRPVADFGFVRVHTDQGNRYFRVPLLNSREVEHAWDLRMAIKRGEEMGAANGDPHFCKKCTKRTRCDRWA